MISKLETESAKLKWAWDRHSSNFLDEYLVRNHEDPRVNIQSILTRSFVIDTLWPNQFDDLISDELRFGAIMCWFVKELGEGKNRYCILDSISRSDPVLPKFITETYEWLESKKCSIINYISAALSSDDPDHPEILLNQHALGTFEYIWSSLLHNRNAKRVSLTEFGPGSANDYRYFDSFGIARFIDYHGIDISKKNVLNARRRCPNTFFSVGSIFNSGLPDDSVDYILAHDLFEHFSPQGLEVSLSEVMRICKKEAWLNFFNATYAEEHFFEPYDDYYWNKLSIKRLIESLHEVSSTVEVIVIQDMLNTKYNYGSFYNPQAVTIIASK